MTGVRWLRPLAALKARRRRRAEAEARVVAAIRSARLDTARRDIADGLRHRGVDR